MGSIHELVFPTPEHPGTLAECETVVHELRTWTRDAKLSSGRNPMILFVNGRVFDGTGEAPFEGSLLIKDNRIASITRGGISPSPGAGTQM